MSCIQKSTTTNVFIISVNSKTDCSNYATPLFEMAEVNPSVQKKICSSLSMKPKGGSCLGCGVHEALKVRYREWKQFFLLITL